MHAALCVPACPAWPPAHPAKNTAGLKFDRLSSGLLRVAGSLTPGWAPRPQGQQGTPLPLPGQGSQARESRAQMLGLHCPLPWVNLTDPPEQPGWHGGRLTSADTPSCPGPGEDAEASVSHCGFLSLPRCLSVVLAGECQSLRRGGVGPRYPLLLYHPSCLVRVSKPKGPMRRRKAEERRASVAPFNRRGTWLSWDLRLGPGVR